MVVHAQERQQVLQIPANLHQLNSLSRGRGGGGGGGEERQADSNIINLLTKECMSLANVGSSGWSTRSDDDEEEEQSKSVQPRI